MIITVEVTNGFKGLDLVDRVPEEIWKEVHNIAQDVVIKTIPQKEKCEKQRRKGKIYPFECRVPKNSKER